jgi:hypothetical protein
MGLPTTPWTPKDLTIPALHAATHRYPLNLRQSRDWKIWVDSYLTNDIPEARAKAPAKMSSETTKPANLAISDDFDDFDDEFGKLTELAELDVSPPQTTKSKVDTLALTKRKLTERI